MVIFVAGTSALTGSLLQELYDVFTVIHPHPCPPPADRIWHSQSFNVGTAGAKIFSGPAAEEFGYKVQQATNHEGKWYEINVQLK